MYLRASGVFEITVIIRFLGAHMLDALLIFLTRLF